MVTLSETKHATEWLRQFEIDDQVTAAALLDRMRFVPGAEVLSGVRTLAEEFLQRDPLQAPVTIVPIISIEDMLGVDRSLVPKPVVFDDFDPSQPIAAEPGSEALVAHMIRELRKGSPTQIVSTPITRESMKNAHARTLLCITDYIGSGQQVLQYIETWHRHKTIRSWRSLGLLKIVILAYAATPHGKKRVLSSRHVDGLELIEIAPGIEQIDYDDKFKELCRLYAKRARLGRPPPYQDSAGLFANSFSIPNNLPAILIRSSPRWKPFFENRTVSAALAREIGSQLSTNHISKELIRAGRSELALRIESGHIDLRWHRHLTVLALLPEDFDLLPIKVGINPLQLKAILISLRQLNLIDESSRLTPAGKRALKAHRQKPRITSAMLAPDPSPYYPRYKR